MRVTKGEQSQSHIGAQIWEDALSRSKECGVGQQLLFLVLLESLAALAERNEEYNPQVGAEPRR